MTHALAIIGGQIAFALAFVLTLWGADKISAARLRRRIRRQRERLARNRGAYNLVQVMRSPWDERERDQ